MTSNGPSGIGFVNFGDIKVLDVQAPIHTTGKGARGFNLYDGGLGSATFASIATTGDGSIGIQVSRPMGMLKVARDVTTTGGAGMSLVKGIQTPFKAVAVSVKEGGKVEAIEVGGKVATRGDGVTSLEVEGRIGRLVVSGGISATGRRSDAVHASTELPGLDQIEVSAADGRTLVRET